MFKYLFVSLKLLNVFIFTASSVGVAGIPGFFMSSILMDTFGRRIAHGLVILPGTVGWLLIYFASDIPTIMAGRVLGGMTAGATVSLGAIAIGEYSSSKYRGMFLNLKTASVSLGGMTVHLLANYLTWRAIALVATVPHVVAMLIVLTWTESPAWLASRQEFQKCEESFYWLRGKTEESSRELEELIKAQMKRSHSRKELSFTDKVVEFFMKFTRKDFMKPLTICIAGAVLLETCGRHIFPAYAMLIIGEITGNSTHSFYYTLCLDLIIVTSAISSSILVRMTKRRTLLFSTGVAAFCVLMSVCTYLFLASRGIISKDNTLPIALFVLYFILANLGCTPIPLALLGEIYPLAHRAAGSAMTGIVMSLCVMLGLQLTPLLLINVKVYGTFAVYGAVMGVSLLVLYVMLPETKDKTLQEIEDYFNYGSFKKRVDDDEAATKMVPIIQ